MRFVPSLSFGGYNNNGISRYIDSHYSSTSLKANLNFDVLKNKTFSFFMGAGFMLNHSSGYFSGHFNEFNFALNGSVGFRFHSPDKRMGYELLLADGVAKKNFGEGTFLRTRIIVKLK